MTRRRLHRQSPSSPLLRPHGDLCAFWGLRILLDLGGWKRLHGYPHRLTMDGDLLRGLGLGEYEDRELTPAAFARLLRERQLALEAAGEALYKPLLAGLARLGAAFRLDPVEQRILAFAGLIHEGGFLDDTADHLGTLNSAGVIQALTVILDLPREAVKTALASDGHLSRSGLLRIDRGNSHLLRSKLEPLDGIGDLLFDDSIGVSDLLSAHFAPAAPPSLTLADYPHLTAGIADLRDYLARARGQQLIGVNVLLHGPPGTGKTELAAALAADLGCTLYAVSCNDEDGDPIGGTQRFRAYQLAQHCLAREPQALVLFDEVEDVFDDYDSPFAALLADGRDRSKGFTNRLLESNPVPTFWITNAVQAIDPAFKRRFDLVLELPIPPQRVRRRIAEQHLGKLPVRAPWLDRFAHHAQITPGLVERAARVVTTIGTDQPEALEAQLERLIGGHLQARGLPRRLETRAPTLTAYRPDLLNPDRPLGPVVDGLARTRQGRLCLYGPPGTGKTAFAHYLSEVLERPLLVKRASDLLRAYVGETEQRIAAMFHEAESDQSVLLLDEADSFLRDRGQAQRSWEVTQVNELLTQMESFGGVFVCATNLIDDLDAAAARRFDLKVRFAALRPEQRWALFQQVLVEHGSKRLRQTHWMPKLAGLDDLTPGDFATVIRQRRITGEPLTAEALLAGLQSECDFKRRTRTRPIGFTAGL